MIENMKRRIYHLFKSGCFVIGLEHFLVMFPSAMLIARLANTSFGSVIELPSILLACGIGTLVFSVFTKWKIPFFLGPSFSYIGFVSYQVAQITAPNDIVAIRSTIYYGYIIAGVFLLLLSWLYRFDRIKRIINTLFPSTIMGPAISLIGLELANMAAQDSGFTDGTLSIKFLAIITLVCIIIVSLVKHHFLQNASILIGVVFGCVIATIMGSVTWPISRDVKILIPEFYFESFNHPPRQWLALILSIFPCTMIAFVESLGRLTVYKGMLKRDEKPYDVSLSNTAISMHSATSILTSITSMMPSAIYAENLAIMNLHGADLSTKHIVIKDEDPFINRCYSAYSIYPYVIASLISIFVALFSGLQELFLSIPISILGGMELFVFGLISAPGIQMLVEQQVNYKKISNQIITASVFMAGISDISITYGALTLRGMSLGLTIGVIVNIITLILGYFGYLNERFSLNEIIDECMRVFNQRVTLSLYNEEGSEILTKELEVYEWKEYIRQKEISNLLKRAYRIELKDSLIKKNLIIYQEVGRINLRVELLNKYLTRLLNDNPRVITIDRTNQSVTIVVDENISKRLLADVIKNAK